LEVLGIEGTGPVRRMLEQEGWRWAAEKGKEGVWMVWRWGRRSVDRGKSEHGKGMT
jgi:hypothetical protein